MKTKVKKIICILITTILIVSMPISVFAVTADNENKDKASLEEVIADIENTYENAEIFVENGVINVLVTEEDTFSPLTRAADETKTIYAPEGGTWRNFVPPWYYALTPDATKPYAKVYLPHEHCEAILSTPEPVWKLIRDSYLANKTIDTIVLLVAAKYAVDISPVVALFLAGINIYSDIENMNNNAFKKAFNESSAGKVVITYTESKGWPMNIYGSWNDNYVTNSPWESFKPVFYRGEVSI